MSRTHLIAIVALVSAAVLCLVFVMIRGHRGIPQQLNPGALVPVMLTTEADFADRFSKEPGYVPGGSCGFTMPNRKGIWLIGSPGSCTWQRSGMLTHEVVFHLAPQFRGDAVAAFGAVCNVDSFNHDTHGLGRAALKAQGVIP